MKVLEVHETISICQFQALLTIKIALKRGAWGKGELCPPSPWGGGGGGGGGGVVGPQNPSPPPPPPPPAASPVYIMSRSNGKCLAIENIEIFFGEEVSTL